VLRDARLARGLTGYQAAQQFRRDPSRWSRWEREEEPLPLRLRIRIAARWNLPALAYEDPDLASLLAAARRWPGPDDDPPACAALRRAA
jgi:transcriptional regulator with XRE-family HTH domain